MDQIGTRTTHKKKWISMPSNKKHGLGVAILIQAIKHVMKFVALLIDECLVKCSHPENIWSERPQKQKTRFNRFFDSKKVVFTCPKKFANTRKLKKQWFLEKRVSSKLEVCGFSDPNSENYRETGGEKDLTDCVKSKKSFRFAHLGGL